MDLDFDKYKAQQFCDHLDCEAYGKTGGNNIRRLFAKFEAKLGEGPRRKTVSNRGDCRYGPER
jgi:hypothetical protein